MKIDFLKTLALLAMAGGASFVYAAEHSEIRYNLEDRSAWTITGCSQCEGGNKSSDGGLQELIDDNVNSFWHSNWSEGGDDGPGHYFIIDRTENAPEIARFSYLSRQGNNNANGFVTKYRLFAVDEAPELPVCSGSWTTAQGAHDAAEAWFADKTPVAEGTFDFIFNDLTTHHERTVDLTSPTSARYLIFVVDDAVGVQGNKFANCAEFKTYTKETLVWNDPQDSLRDKRFKLKNVMHGLYAGVYKPDKTLMGNTSGADAVWTIVETPEGKVKLHNEMYDCFVGQMPDTNNTRIPFVNSADEAGEWIMEWAEINKKVVIRTGQGGVDAIHMVDWDGLVRWYPDADASQFELILASDEDYEAWVATYTEEALCPGAIGYHGPSDEFREALEDVKANPADLSKHRQVLEAAETGELALPLASRYYTISCVNDDFKGKYFVEPYGQSSTMHIADMSENIVPYLWQFSAGEGEDSDLYTLSAANSSKVLSKVSGSAPLSMLESADENVGRYDILNPHQRASQGVSLVCYNDAERSGFEAATILNGYTGYEDWAVYSYTPWANAWKIEEVNQIPVKFSEGYASFNFPFAVVLPVGVKAYTVVKTDASRAYITPIEGDLVAANLPVILTSEEPTVSFPIASSFIDAQDVTASVLKGTNTPIDAPENAYVFSEGIFSPVSGSIPANSVYLTSDAEGDLEVAIMVTGISLSKTELTLEEGTAETISVIFEPEDATPLSVTWTSSNKAVATVLGNGRVSAGIAGKAVLTAKCGDFTAKCNVTVVPKPVPAESITLSATELTLEEGETATLTATVAPEEATDKSVVWTSSNEVVATVSEEGEVVALAEGTAVITATCGDVKADCAVTVMAKIEEDLIDEIRADVTAFELYDLAGRRIFSAPARGIYILNRAGRAVKVTL